MCLVDGRICRMGAFNRTITKMLLRHGYIHLFPFKNKNPFVNNILDIYIDSYTCKFSSIIKINLAYAI